MYHSQNEMKIQLRTANIHWVLSALLIMMAPQALEGRSGGALRVRASYYSPQLPVAAQHRGDVNGSIDEDTLITFPLRPPTTTAADAAPPPPPPSPFAFEVPAEMMELAVRAEGIDRGLMRNKKWRWHGPADEPRYHLYDPSHFPTTFGSCKFTAGQSGLKHNVDTFFVHQLLRENKSVPAKEAELFVLPSLLSQWSLKRCGQPPPKSPDGQVGNFYDEITDFLSNSTWFRRFHGADHLIVADNFWLGKIVNRLPGALIHGRFETTKPHVRWPRRKNNANVDESMSVGYATLAGEAALGLENEATRALVVPFEQRKYDCCFVGSVDNRGAYVSRMQLKCSWLHSLPAQRERFLVHMKGGLRNCPAPSLVQKTPRYHGRMPITGALGALRDSRFFMALTGDTPTTDRLFSMFDTQTIPIVLSNRLEGLIATLPFHFAVPWRDIFVVVDHQAWTKNPMQSVLDTIDALTPQEVAMRRELLRRHADDVTYKNSNSTRAHTNILIAAWAIARQQVAAAV